MVTSHELTPKGREGREIPLFQEIPGWWNKRLWTRTLTRLAIPWFVGDPFITRWWFQFFFTPTWWRFPFWLIFFKGVETTNQIRTFVRDITGGGPALDLVHRPSRAMSWVPRMPFLAPHKSRKWWLRKRYLAHRIHMTGIFTYICLIFMVNVLVPRILWVGRLIRFY